MLHLCKRTCGGGAEDLNDGFASFQSWKVGIGEGHVWFQECRCERCKVSSVQEAVELRTRR